VGMMTAPLWRLWQNNWMRKPKFNLILSSDDVIDTFFL
jgi:hypothetical protein